MHEMYKKAVEYGTCNIQQIDAIDRLVKKDRQAHIEKLESMLKEETPYSKPSLLQYNQAIQDTISYLKSLEDKQ